MTGDDVRAALGLGGNLNSDAGVAIMSDDLPQRLRVSHALEYRGYPHNHRRVWDHAGRAWDRSAAPTNGMSGLWPRLCGDGILNRVIVKCDATRRRIPFWETPPPAQRRPPLADATLLCAQARSRSQCAHADHTEPCRRPQTPKSHQGMPTSEPAEIAELREPAQLPPGQPHPPFWA
jgi:hypothetical protein